MTIFVCFFAYCWACVVFSRKSNGLGVKFKPAFWLPDLLDVFWPLTLILGVWVIYFTPIGARMFPRRPK